MSSTSSEGNVPVALEMKNLTKVESSYIQRYTRSELYLIRYELKSRRRPECINRIDLKNLSFWKNNVSNQFNGSCVNNVATVTENVSNGCSSQTVCTSSINLRNIRSRDRGSNYYRRPNNENEPGYSLSMTHAASPLSAQSTHNNSVQKTVIDHRSISSAHLMPAFAKRRFVIATTSPPADHQSNNAAVNKNSTFDERDREDACDITLKSSKDQFSEICENSKSMVSPQRKITVTNDTDGFSEHTELKSRSVSSPTSTTNARYSGGGHIINERRIGSGRLISRELSWDVRNQEKVKNFDKETPTHSSHYTYQYNNGRFNDRSHERSEVYTERRSYERRDVTDDIRDKYENVINKVNSQGSRRTSSKDFYKNLDGNLNQTNNGRSRRLPNQFNDRNEEPEWFSSGPTSQHDTIELHGFEVFEKGQEKPETDMQEYREFNPLRKLKNDYNISNSKKSSEVLEKLKETSEIQTKLNESNVSRFVSTVETNAKTANTAEHQDRHEKIGVKDFLKNSDGELEFNFDAFLNMDSLSQTLVGNQLNTNDQNMIEASRFSRWFVSKSHDSSQIEVPTEKVNHSASVDKNFNTLREFLQSTQIPMKSCRLDPPLLISSITSVEELEARMRKIDTNSVLNETEQADIVKSVGIAHIGDKLQNKLGSVSKDSVPSEDARAFKKLLEQLNISNNNTSLTTDTIHLPNEIVSQIPCNSSNSPNPMPTSDVPVIPSHLLKSENVKKVTPQQFLQHQPILQSQPQKLLEVSFPLVPHFHQQQPSLQRQQLRQMEIGPITHPIHTNQTIKRLEIHNLLQRVNRGDISIALLEHELNNASTSAHNKDIIVAVLNERSRSVTPSGLLVNSLPVSQNLINEAKKHNLPHSTVNIELSPQQDLSQTSNSNLIMVSGQTETNALAEQHFSAEDGSLQPDSILAHIFFKNKLEEQQETQRKRQEFEQNKQHQISNILVHQTGAHLSNLQHHRQNNSPTRLAFTPTSVLRKMTAEKECFAPQPQSTTTTHISLSLPHNLHNYSKQTGFINHQHMSVPQPRMILGGNPILHQSGNNSQHSPQALIQSYPQMRNSQQQLKWHQQPMNTNLPTNKNLGGRPILKGPLHPLSTQSHQQPQMTYASKIEFQQMQHQRFNQTPQQMQNHQQNSTSTSAQNFHHQYPPSQSHNNIMSHIQQHQSFQQQRNIGLYRQQQQQLQLQLNQHVDSGTNRTGTCESNVRNNLISNNVISYQRDGGLSPTSNQLAQWFSPELLAQASAGKLPLLNMNQTLSLEEFERSIQHSSTTVHN